MCLGYIRIRIRRNMRKYNFYRNDSVDGFFDSTIASCWFVFQNILDDNKYCYL